MFNQYFAAGIAVAGIYSGDLSGNQAQRAGYTTLYNELVNNRGYAAQFSFHTRSRGGLLGYNWAADNPGKVAAIGGIYPVTNLLSYPGAGTAASHYGITVTELTTNGHLYNPIDRLAPLASAGVKMFHIHGDSDGTVPLNLNSQITKDRYDALGGDMTLTVIVGGGHDGNNHWWTNQPLTDFMIAETLAAASTVGPPTLKTQSSVVPADDATDVIANSNLVATFSEAIALTGSGTITLKNLSGGADIPISLPVDVTIVGRVLTINPASNLIGGEEYAVVVSSDAIEDLDATPSPYAGLLSTDTPNWSFTAGLPDLTAPIISTLSPGDNMSGVSGGTNLVVTFNENIAIGTGNITIKDLDTSAQTTIPVGDAQVSVSGAVLTINPGPNLASVTNYAIQLDATAIDDISGNSFAGITDDTTWNFATETPPAEESSTTQLAYAGDVSSSDLLHGLTATTTGWNFSSGATPANLNDGSHGTSYDDVGGASVATIAWTTVGATAEYNLGTGANGLGFNLTSIQSIADWNSAAFGNQAYTVEVKPMGGSYTTLATVDYQPLTSAGTTKVTLTDPSGVLASGIEFIKFTANSVNGGSNGGVFTFREIDVFGVDTTSNTFANWIGGYDVGVLTGFGDDMDGDDLANGLEAWFGTHPGQWNSGLALGSTVGLVTTFTHPQNSTPPEDLTGYYEWSPNLTDWFTTGTGPSGGATVTFSASTTGTTTTVTATASEAVERVFLRAGVMQN